VYEVWVVIGIYEGGYSVSCLCGKFDEVIIGDDGEGVKENGFIC
jgi:hypothetical protein